MLSINPLDKVEYLKEDDSIARLRREAEQKAKEANHAIASQAIGAQDFFIVV